MSAHFGSVRAFARSVRVVLAAVSVFLLGAVADLTAQAPQESPSCAQCETRTRCVSTSEPGLYSTGCSIAAGQDCAEDLGLCYIDGGLAARELRLDGSDLLPIEISGAPVVLAHLGDSLYAAWNCEGQLAYLARRDRNQRMIPLPIEEHRERFAFARLVLASREEAAALGPEQV